jgi:protein-S-isoprenylcysteine O-methyltransferase Ste14
MALTTPGFSVGSHRQILSGFDLAKRPGHPSAVLLLKSLLFAILLPGTVTLFVPYLMLSRSHTSPRWASLSVLAFIPLTAGATILLRCIWDFAVSGRGTLAPIDPPKELVVHGLYRYVRNPMYVGVLLVLLGEAWLFDSRALLVYAGGFWVVASAFVFFYEEPTLRRKFGGSYARYYRSVNRWVPRKPSGTSL